MWGVGRDSSRQGFGNAEPAACPQAPVGINAYMPTHIECRLAATGPIPVQSPRPIPWARRAELIDAAGRDQRNGTVHPGPVDFQQRAGGLVQRLRSELECRARRGHRRRRARADAGIQRGLHREGLGHPEPLRDRQARRSRPRAHVPRHPRAPGRPALAAVRDGRARGARGAGAGRAHRRRHRRGHRRLLEPAAPLPGRQRRGAGGAGHRGLRLRHERRLLLGHLRHRHGAQRGAHRLGARGAGDQPRDLLRAPGVPRP